MLLYREYKLRKARQFVASHDELLFYFQFSIYIWDINKECMGELVSAAARHKVNLATINTKTATHSVLQNFLTALDAWHKAPSILENVHNCYIAAVQVSKL